MAAWPAMNQGRGVLVAVAALASCLGGITSTPAGARPAPPAVAAATPAAAPLHVRGNALVDGKGRHVRLLGVNRAGPEGQCMHSPAPGVTPNQIFDGPVSDRAIARMKAWHINAVRILLNEDCWLGINNTVPAVSGQAYQDAIADYVNRLNSAGMYVILTLATSAPRNYPSSAPQRMADADHAPAFWTSVATRFSRNGAVLFDLYNEPYNISWKCWRDGCSTSLGFQLAGMQQLVNAVRSTGARQPIMLGGLSHATTLAHWYQFRPRDPAHALVASVHVYSFATYSNPVFWGAILQPLARKVPIVAGEIGEIDCRHTFIDRFMPWADGQGVSYLAWTWNSSPLWGCQALIKRYSGSPTRYGIGFRNHLAALARP